MSHLDPEDLVKSQVSSSKAAMPLHYNAARYTQSMRGKHHVLNLVAEPATYEACMVLEDVLKAADAKARAEVDKGCGKRSARGLVITTDRGSISQGN